MTGLIYEITEEEVDERLDKLVVSLVDGKSRHQIQRLIKAGYVKVNGKEVKPNYRCKAKDIIRIEIEEEQERKIEAENIPLEIVHEDDHIIVLNKPKGMLVHPTDHVTSNTLVNALKYYTDKLSTVGGSERAGIVHRLDQNTSGIMVVCKDNDTHEHLKQQFQAKSVTRIYEALVFGSVKHEKGIIQAPIGRNPQHRLQMAVVPEGKQAETHFKLLYKGERFSYLECRLITGRMHQIRVHMKYMNHPIVGDPVYSRKKVAEFDSQALYAKTIGFIHPKTGKYVEFSIERPKEFTDFLDRYQLKP